MANQTSLLKYSLKTNIVKSILFEVISKVSNYYYVFGRSQEWPTVSGVNPLTNSTEILSSEEDPPGISDTYSAELESRRNIIYSKLIDSNDVALVVRRINWTSGFTYDQYDDYTEDNPSYTGAASISEALFYVLTDDFNVYKCLYNNNGAQSIVKPTGTSTDPVTESDGYIWKFMYSVPISLRNKFLNSTYMPVTTSLTNQFYSRGSILDYVIEDRGKKYIANTWKIKRILVMNTGSGYTTSAVAPNLADNLTITFPSPDMSGGIQAVVTNNDIYIDQQGHVISINVNSNNTGYSTQVQPIVHHGSGTNLDIIVEYSVDDAAYTKLRVVGDGYNELNPYTLKTVTVINKGSYDAPLSGDLYSVSASRLSTAKLPQLQFNFLPQEAATATAISTIEAGKKYIIASVGTTTTAQWNALGVTGNPTTAATPPVQIFTALINGTSAMGSGTVKRVTYIIDTVDVLDEGYAFTEPLTPQSPVGSYAQGTVSFNAAIISGGFKCDFNVNTQKNEAELIPIINTDGEITAVIVQNSGIGYTFASVIIEAKKKVLVDPLVPEMGYTYRDIQGTDPTDTQTYEEGFEDGSILLQFGVGDVDTRQSNVELQAVDGSIPVVNVDYGGSGYPSPVYGLDENNTVIQTGGTTISLEGDGTGWSGRLIIQNGSIKKVEVLNAGSGYTYANVVLNPLLTGAAGAILRPIISPKGGHGKDSVAELYCNSLLMVTKLSVEKNKGIIATNDYRQVAIIKNLKAYNEDVFLRSPSSSSCAMFICDINSLNTSSYNELEKNDILNYSFGGQTKTFTLIDKTILNNKYYLLVQVNDNYITLPGSSVFKQDGSSSYNISITSVLQPDFDKYSGEMLYLNNRTKFSPSEEQTIIASTLLSF